LRSFDRVIMLHGGKIIEGPPDRLMHGYRPAREPATRGNGPPCRACGIQRLLFSSEFVPLGVPSRENA
jgi:hypothetical protein